jgi:hypothetical protein
LEGRLNPPNENDLPSVTICKFLKNIDYDNNPFRSSFVLVTADLDGYLNFYAVDGVLKNQLLCRRREVNLDEQIAGKQDKEDLIYFAIRGIDYDPEEKMLWTGDELGYMQKWDVSSLLAKLIEKEELTI